MEYRRLGSTGLLVPAVGLGANNFGVRGRTDPAQAACVIDQAMDLGATFISTANIYGQGLGEQIIGHALKGKRDRAIIATKVGRAMGEGPNTQGASRLHILREVDASLKRPDTDYIDLYQLHDADPNTPVEETLRTLDSLVQQGKVRYIGCSQHTPWQVCELVLTARMMRLEPVVSVEQEYNMLARQIENELIPMCKAYNLGILPFFPLANGFLTGKYQPGQPPPQGTRLANSPRKDMILTPENFAVLGQLQEFAMDRGHTMAELAIAWLLANPVVSCVIAGATRPEQVAENVKAASWYLTPEEMAELDGVLVVNGPD